MILLRTLRALATVAALAAFPVLTSGCGDSPTSPNNAPYNQTDLLLGTGADAVLGRLVLVHYTGWYFDAAKPDQKGPQFDSSSGQPAFSFVLGAGEVIGGWDQGVQGMKVGGVRRLVIPPSLAYGGTRFGPIPPYATLLFDIQLVEVQ